MRPPLVAGNWKMHLLSEQARNLAVATARAVREHPGVEVALFPSFPLLHVVRTALDGAPVVLGAQTCHEEHEGAHTGEVSALQLAEAGCRMVLAGHSERRAAGESDESVGRRARAALRAGLRPVVCVGERLEERERGATEEVLSRQLGAALAEVEARSLPALELAYEPVWAIGTGRTATPEIAAEAHRFLRKLLVDKYQEAGRAPRILYGGSVKPQNARELMAAAEVGGVLVGGASLEAASFGGIVAAAAQVA